MTERLFVGTAVSALRHQHSQTTPLFRLTFRLLLFLAPEYRPRFQLVHRALV